MRDFICLSDEDACNVTADHLHALVHESEDVTSSNQLLNGASQTLSQSAKKIQSYDHEVFVGGLILVWLRLVKLEKSKKFNLTDISE